MHAVNILHTYVVMDDVSLDVTDDLLCGDVPAKHTSSRASIVTHGDISSCMSIAAEGKLQQCFTTKYSCPVEKAEKIAHKVQKAVLHLHGNDGQYHRTISRILQIARMFGTASEPLVQLAAGTLSPEVFVKMDSWSAAPQEVRESFAQRRRHAHEMNTADSAKIESICEGIRCPKCSQCKVTGWSEQRSAADEPANQMYRCTIRSCAYAWNAGKH